MFIKLQTLFFQQSTFEQTIAFNTVGEPARLVKACTAFAAFNYTFLPREYYLLAITVFA